MTIDNCLNITKLAVGLYSFLQINEDTFLRGMELVRIPKIIVYAIAIKHLLEQKHNSL